MTDKGEKTLSQARRVIAQHEKRFTGRFTAAELKGLVLALSRIHGQV